MPVDDGRSQTGGNGLHGRLYYRPATCLKSKVWLYCIKFCRRETPAGAESAAEKSVDFT
jgi:hypothetical protein